MSKIRRVPAVASHAVQLGSNSVPATSACPVDVQRNMTNFWLALGSDATTTQPNENTIMLANDQHWFNCTYSTKLFERTCYKELYDEINSDNVGWNAKPLQENIMIVGASGIGKSMFLYYVMWRLRSADAAVKIVFQTIDKSRFYFHG